MQDSSKNLLLLFVIAVLFLSLAVIFSINKPFTLDEAIPFAWNAHVINQSGVSVLGQREGENTVETVLEIAHPPLYNLILALTFDLFGESDISGRMLGVICLFLTAVILLKVARQSYVQENARNIWLITVSIIAINPYFVQYALLLDTDTSILTLFMTGTIYFFLRYLQIKSKLYLVITALALGASFWAKEITPPILIVAFFFFLWLQEGFTRAFVQTMMISFIGVASFWLTWWGFCEITNVPIMSFIEFTILQKGAQAAPFTYPLTSLIVFIIITFWLSLPLIILFVLCLFERMKDFKCTRSLKPSDFLFIYICLMFIYTVIYIPSSTNLKLLKYSYPMAPILVMVTSAFIHKLFIRISTTDVLIFFVVSFSVLVFYLVFNREDPLMLLYSGALLSLSRESLIFFSPLVFAAIVLYLFRPSFTWIRSMIYASLFTLMPMNIYLATQQMSDYTTSLSWSNYGEKGFSQTVDYLDNHLRPNDNVIMRKDLGYYLKIRRGFKTVQWSNPLYRNEIEEMKENIDVINRSQKISFIVLDKYSNPRVSTELVLPYYSLDKKVGDFYIYRRNKLPGADRSEDI